MERVRNRVAEPLLLAVMVISGTLTIHGVVHGTCGDGYCKEVRFFTICSVGGAVQDLSDCYICDNGVCDGGDEEMLCTDTGAALAVALTNVTAVCDCQGLSYAEATGTYTGDYGAVARTRKTCQMPGS